MDLITSTIIPPALLPLVVIIAALLLERFLPLHHSIDPLSLYRFVCERMASKVLKTHYVGQQALISGTLALVVLLAPTLIIMYLLHSFASYQWLLDILILYVLLQYSHHVKKVTKAITALQQNKKQLAKNLLQPHVLRQVAPLSAMGLIKASIESLYLRYMYQQVAVIFCYVLAGPVFALAYRLCYEANHAWNPKLAHFGDFGRFATAAVKLVQIIPVALSAWLLVIFLKPTTAFRLVGSSIYWKGLLQHQYPTLLLSLSYALQIKTGGPAMYANTKVRRMRFSDAKRACNEP
ncbi:MAG: cobalamin biosynthesis protein, partial [Glaciecola sp.]